LERGDQPTDRRALGGENETDTQQPADGARQLTGPGQIPGSGTGQLIGLRGEGGFRANLGEGAQVHLDYWFE
jgi:hypothetical protein